MHMYAHPRIYLQQEYMRGNFVLPTFVRLKECFQQAYYIAGLSVMAVHVQ